MSSCVRSIMACLLVMFLPAIALAEVVPAQDGWLDSLRHGGYVIVVRHTLTGSDASKDAMANPKSAEASKPGKGERQLSEQGRAQATSIGQAMHKLKIPVSLVVTSPLQRAVDTGT